MKRFTRTLAVGVLAAGLLGVIGVGTASAGSGEVGYTVGLESIDGGIAECDFYSVELATGVMTEINANPLECADGLTFSPDGTLYAYVSPRPVGFSNAQLFTIDVTDGSQAFVGTLPPVVLGSGGMTFDAAGNLWLYGTPATGMDPDCGTSGFESCLWQVDPTDGSTTFVGGQTERIVYGLAATCAGVYAITTPIPGGLVSGTEVALVDTATGGLDLVVSTDDINNPEGLDFDFSGALWALGSGPESGIPNWTIFDVDLTTGASTGQAMTLDGGPFFGFLFGLAISPTEPCPAPPTPEPIVITPTFTG